MQEIKAGQLWRVSDAIRTRNSLVLVLKQRKVQGSPRVLWYCRYLVDQSHGYISEEWMRHNWQLI